MGFVPRALVPSDNGLCFADLDDLMLFNNVIYITGPITRDMAVEFHKQMIHICTSTKKDADINIHVFIDSDGGDLTSAYIISDAIRTSRFPVETRIIGHAFSAAALIASSGHSRTMTAHAKLMIHEPKINPSFSGSVPEIVDVADRLTIERNTVCRLIAQNTGKEPSEILGYMVNETYFDSKTALENGLVDNVVKSV